MTYGPLTAERIAETDAMLAAYAAATNHTEHWNRYADVEQRMNAESRMGRFKESDRIRAAMNATSRKVRLEGFPQPVTTHTQHEAA